MAVEIGADLKAELIEVLTDGLLTDGAHHKQHSLETALKLLTDCPAVILEATDARGGSYGYEALSESQEFKELKRSLIHPDDLAAYEEEGADLEELTPWEPGIPA